MKELKIGISGLGILHTDAAVPDVETKFRMARESGAFDYVDRTPPPPELDAHLEAVQGTTFRSSRAASSTWSGATRRCWNAISAPACSVSVSASSRMIASAKRRDRAEWACSLEKKHSDNKNDHVRKPLGGRSVRTFGNTAKGLDLGARARKCLRPPLPADQP